MLRRKMMTPPLMPRTRFPSSPDKASSPIRSQVEVSYDFFSKPILNNPYARPSRHWELDEAGPADSPNQTVGARAISKLREDPR